MCIVNCLLILLNDVLHLQTFPLEYNEAGAKDIDLRMGILPSVVPTTVTGAVAIVAGTSTSPIEPKKRLSIEQSADEPKSKKSKSDKIDMYVFRFFFFKYFFFNRLCSFRLCVPYYWFSKIKIFLLFFVSILLDYLERMMVTDCLAPKTSISEH